MDKVEVTSDGLRKRRGGGQAGLNARHFHLLSRGEGGHFTPFLHHTSLGRSGTQARDRRMQEGGMGSEEPSSALNLAPRHKDRTASLRGALERADSPASTEVRRAGSTRLDRAGSTRLRPRPGPVKVGSLRRQDSNALPRSKSARRTNSLARADRYLNARSVRRGTDLAS